MFRRLVLRSRLASSARAETVRRGSDCGKTPFLREAVAAKSLDVFHTGQSEELRYGMRLFVSAAVLAGGFILHSGVFCSPQSDDETDRKAEWASIEDIKARLKPLLSSIRSRHQGPIPSVRVSSHQDGCKGLSFTVERERAGLALHTLLVGLNKEHGPKSVVLQVDPATSRESYDGQVEEKEEVDGAVTFVFDDQSGSVRLGVGKDAREELTLYKDQGLFSQGELDAFARAYDKGGFPNGKVPGGSFTFGPAGSDLGSLFERALGDSVGTSASGNRDAGRNKKKTPDQVLARLEELGAQVYRAESDSSEHALDWSALAGCPEVRREVEDTVLLGLTHAAEFESVARKTRARFESNRPRAILFEGPPGVGKTLTARIVASVASVPLIYVPVESVVSKWYGESESRLSEVLELCDSLESSAIVFLDEIDSLVTSRGSRGDSSSSGMHEATRRLLSVLLRTLEGFSTRGDKASVLIAATNRKQDLDHALLSRFDVSVAFPLPPQAARAEIIRLYAAQLSNVDVGKLALLSEGCSGRDIKDACKRAERRWVSERLRHRGGNEGIGTPPCEFYEHALFLRKQQLMDPTF